MLMGNKCCATDVLNRFTIFFIIISSPTIEVVFKKTSWTNIDEWYVLVQVFEQRFNEFQVLEPLLVAMVSDLWNRFCIFFCTISILSMSLHKSGDQKWTAYALVVEVLGNES